MIKMCDESLVRPVSIISRNSLNSCIYPSTCKKANVIPVHKKDDKQCVNNHRPLSLLPVFGKIFEKLIFNEIYSFLDREKLFYTNQSGFRPSDSCVKQLLIKTHKIFSSFDWILSLEVHSIFLDISKAFNKVWHEDLLYKLLVSLEILNLIQHYLTNRFQRVLLNGQCSNWQSVLVVVPQGSILGPLFFLIYVNEMPDGLKSNVKLFADDTSYFSVIKNKDESASDLTNDLDTISIWAYKWKIPFNLDPKKTRARGIIL